MNQDELPTTCPYCGRMNDADNNGEECTIVTGEGE